MLRLAIIVLFINLLSSCGFHLRGGYQLPAQMQKTYLLSEIKPGLLTQKLQQSLIDNQIQLVDSPEEAFEVLRLYDEKTIRRIVSVDAQGRAREYALSYQLKFELNPVGDKADLLIEPQTLQLQKSYLFDPEDILGKAREEQLLIDDMQKDMVRLILLRLQLGPVNTIEKPALLPQKVTGKARGEKFGDSK